MTPTETTTILRQFNEWRRGDEDIPQFDPREIGEALDAAVEMIDRLEAAESDALEQARLNGMGASREAALMAKLEAAEKERDALRARIEAMERQESFDADSDVFRSAFEAALKAGNWPATRQGDGYRSPSTQIAWRVAFSTVNRLTLYLAPGAQPAPSVPEGWKLVPIEPTEKMISDGSCASSLPGPHYISEDCAKQCWKYMLAAAPEVKP